jgi:hypothetical protein
MGTAYDLGTPLTTPLDGASGLFYALSDRLISCEFVELVEDEEETKGLLTLPTDLLPRPGDMVDFPGLDGCVYQDYVVLGRRLSFQRFTRTCILYICHKDDFKD